MKRIMIKFYALMAIILGVIGYYAWFVQPELYGDMGRIGQIPFGLEYEQRIKAPYESMDLRVHTIHQSEPINDSVITIGDSFSQCGKYGYSQFVAKALDCHITNISMEDDCKPEQLFVQLVNRGRIRPKSIVIVESVERSMINRLCNLNFDDNTLIEKKEVANDALAQKSNLLDGVMVWLRTSIGLKQTIHTFNTNRDLFTHKCRQNKLYIYDSKWDGTGDLRYAKSKMTGVDAGCENLQLLYQFAVEHDIRLVYLVAADKYDVYEPFIVAKHEKNPTLDSLPNEEWIVNSKVILQDKAYEGEQDLYFINDTHWSPIGSQIIGEEIAKRVQI